jgi:hypothetical protein
MVNGKLLVASRPAVRIGGELFLPLLPVARALGADVTIGTDLTIRVRRADGATLIYDGRTGEIRAGSVMVGQVRDYPRIRVSVDPDQLLFPLSGLVPLLGVTARRDDDKNLLYLDSAANGARPTSSMDLRWRISAIPTA